MARPTHLGFRAGQWVLFGRERRVGILVYENTIVPTGQRSNRWDCHLVDDKGQTIMVVPNVNFEQLAVATRSDIPASRLETAHKPALDKYYPE